MLAVIDGRIAPEPDPTQHPFYQLVCWHLDRRLTPLDGGQFFDRFNQLVRASVEMCLDEAPARGEE